MVAMRWKRQAKTMPHADVLRALAKPGCTDLCEFPAKLIDAKIAVHSCGALYVLGLLIGDAADFVDGRIQLPVKLFFDQIRQHRQDR